MKDGLVIGLLSLVPRRGVSRWMGRATRLRLPRFVLRAFLRWYVRHYGVDLQEVDGALEDFPTVAQFFTRPLRPGVRPVHADPKTVVSPVDGKVHGAGRIEEGRIPQSPELDFAVSELLAGDSRYERGSYAVIYLSPRDYHRVHSPVRGDVVSFSYRPGRFWPVFPAATRRIRGLFARNERMVARLVTESWGEVACVLVGAFGVGRMAAVFTDLVTNTGVVSRDEELEAPWPLDRGQELGRFEMGSTVVLVFEEGRIDWTIQPGDAVKMGEPIARAAESAAS